MYIDADTIIKAASLLGAIGALVAAIVSVYKVIESNKKQSEFINAIQEEQTLICYGLRGAFDVMALGLMALGLMLASSITLYSVFKKKGWL